MLVSHVPAPVSGPSSFSVVDMKKSGQVGGLPTVPLSDWQLSVSHRSSRLAAATTPVVRYACARGWGWGCDVSLVVVWVWTHGEHDIRRVCFPRRSVTGQPVETMVQVVDAAAGAPVVDDEVMQGPNVVQLHAQHPQRVTLAFSRLVVATSPSS